MAAWWQSAAGDASLYSASLADAGLSAAVSAVSTTTVQPAVADSGGTEGSKLGMELVVGSAVGGGAVVLAVVTAVAWLLLARRRQSQTVAPARKMGESGPVTHTQATAICETPVQAEAARVVPSPPRSSGSGRRGSWFGLPSAVQPGEEAGEPVCDGGLSAGSTAAIAPELEQLEEGRWEAEDLHVCYRGRAVGSTAGLASQLEQVEEGPWRVKDSLGGSDPPSIEMQPPSLPGSVGEETPRGFAVLLDSGRAAGAALDRRARPTTAPPLAQGAAADAAGRGRRGRWPQVGPLLPDPPLVKDPDPGRFHLAFDHNIPKMHILTNAVTCTCTHIYIHVHYTYKCRCLAMLSDASLLAEPF
jgi:hypothetical protein